MADLQVGGVVEPGFEGVREAFTANFERHDEVGAATSVYVHGRKVVDLWGGIADVATSAPYAGDTLQLVFSTTKGATALCANILIQRGLIDPDEPVATYWPEFAAGGKQDIPVRWLLCHKAGLIDVDKQLSLEETLAWDPVIAALEVQEPLWEPGTAHGYHATTYGWLVGEVIRRVSGKSVGTFFADEVARPLGLEFWIGLPDEQQHRVAPLIELDEPSDMDPAMKELIQQFIGPGTMLHRALHAPAGAMSAGIWNDPVVRAAEIPAAGGVTNARSIAKMYAATIGEVDGVGPLLTPEQLDAATTCQTSGSDKCIYVDTTIGLGFWTSSPFAPYGGVRGFGHSGMGGSVGFGDPETGVGFGYVMNKMSINLSGDPRSRGLIRAVYDAMGVKPAFV
jgi:CubicO group peptidase (beta-lactamase class C family)